MPNLKLEYEKNNVEMYINRGFEPSPLVDLIKKSHILVQNEKEASFLLKGSKARKKKLASLLNAHFFGKRLKHYLNFNNAEDILKESFNIDKMNSFILLKEHHGLRKLSRKMVGKGWKVNDILKFFKKFEKEKKGFVGYLENFKINKYLDRDYQELSDIVKDSYIKARKAKEKKIVSPLDLSLFKFKDNVKELVTNIELEDEGELMHHCVGGYINTVNFNHRIFHIEIDSKRSTLEIRKYNGVWKLRQHLREFNNSVFKENKEIANFLVEFLNKELAKKESFYMGCKKLSTNKSLFGDNYLVFLSNLLNSKDTDSLREIVHFEKSEKVQEYIKESLAKLYAHQNHVFVKVSNTSFNDRDYLISKGFFWNPRQKVWWNYVDVSKFSLSANSRWNINYSFKKEDFYQCILSSIHFFKNRTPQKKSQKELLDKIKKMV